MLIRHNIFGTIHELYNKTIPSEIRKFQPYTSSESMTLENKVDPLRVITNLYFILPLLLITIQGGFTP